MTEEQVSALLGRPLTTIETTNFDTYLDIAIENLEDLLCTRIESITEERTFDTREGYSTVFVDLFNQEDTDITVTIDGEVIDSSEYSVRQWNRRTGKWYNSIVFDKRFTEDGEITISADWGFEATGSNSGSDPVYYPPLDLQSVLAGLFGLITKKNKFDGTIASKQVEDFRISFNADADLDDEFYKNYNKTLNKYGLCHIGNIKHGATWC
jgi:hypothetical protein